MSTTLQQCCWWLMLLLQRQGQMIVMRRIDKYFCSYFIKASQGTIRFSLPPLHLVIANGHYKRNEEEIFGN